MEWIKPEHLPTGDDNQQQTLSFDMLRALIAARQAASASHAKAIVSQTAVPATAVNSEAVRQIFASGGASAGTTGQFASSPAPTPTPTPPVGQVPPNATKAGQNDA